MPGDEEGVASFIPPLPLDSGAEICCSFPPRGQVGRGGWVRPPRDPARPPSGAAAPPTPWTGFSRGGLRIVFPTLVPFPHDNHPSVQLLPI